MRKNRRRKIITLIIVFTLLLGFVIGFSAFSSQLLIKLKANVKPNSNDFKVVFSSNSTTLETDPIKATKTGNITADDAIINNINGAPTITNLNATFKKPGDKVEYNFYVLNNGIFDAYLTNIVFNNANGESSFKVCKPDSTTTSVTSACNSIKATIKIGNTIEATSNRIVNSELLKSGASKPVKVTLEYVSGGSSATGAFTVEFGNINLVYSTLDESISTNDSPSKQIFKPDYYFINDPDIPDFQLSVGSDFSSLDISSSNDNFQDEEFYAGFDSEDGETIESVYACFKKDGREYCLKGADSTLNETNKKILTDAFGESFCQRGTNGEAYSCEFGNFTLTINKDGGFSSWWGRACYLDIWAFGCDC